MSEESMTFEWNETQYAVNELNVRATAEMQRHLDRCDKDDLGNLKFVDDIAAMMGIVMRGLGVEVADDDLMNLSQTKFTVLADSITAAMNAQQNGTPARGEGKSDFLSESATSSEKPTGGDQQISSD